MNNNHDSDTDTRKENSGADKDIVDSERKGTRINRYISSSGFCSRRQADEYVAAGRVTVDGEIATPGTQVLPGQTVYLDEKPMIPDEDYLYIALHKPLGITCTTDPRDESNIIDYLHFEKRIYPIGRLDKNSTGLILLTNDGSIVNKILRAEGRHEKEYLVEVDRPITKSFIASMEKGVPILDTVTLPCKIKVLGEKKFKIILTQGLNRQIRRMCEYHEYRVRKLKRTRILNIDLGTLPLGEWRPLTYKEVRDIKALTTHQAKAQK